ncbi:MAG: hypothetical protein L6V81_11470 [Clostridium sp.]|nr:MAG: hypothetical protein L6V81_11470 [Clostridium sp.]
MFKEIKGIAGKPNQIKDQLALRKMAEDAKVDRTETCFRGKSRQTRNDYIESIERIKKYYKEKYPY